LEHFTVEIAVANENSEETNADEPIRRADFGIVGLVMPVFTTESWLYDMQPKFARTKKAQVRALARQFVGT
jgi:hypothetical protein